MVTYELHKLRERFILSPPWGYTQNRNKRGANPRRENATTNKDQAQCKTKENIHTCYIQQHKQQSLVVRS